MKYAGLVILATLAGALLWMGLIREPLPEIPEILGPVSKEVPFDFVIQSMDYNSVELGLKRSVKGKNMFVKFSMDNAFKTGRAGLVLNGISGRSSMSGMSADKYLDDPERKQAKGPDFSDFMKDRSGRTVSSYPLKQVLEEGRGGKSYMLVAHNGPAMNMLQTLNIPRPVTLPKHISELFTDQGIIQFQPGKVAFDRSAQGFHIPVVIR